jgi:hypothetical protein
VLTFKRRKKMRQILALIMILGFFAVATLEIAYAEDGGAEGGSTTSTASLKNNMKQIGTIYKALAVSVKDLSQNAQSAAKAGNLVQLFGLVMQQVPDTISSLAPDQQAAALADFKRMIQIEIDHAMALEKAFESNDNAAALSIITEMGATKKEGHSKYNDN